MFYRLSQMKAFASSFLLVTIILWQAGLGCAFCCLTHSKSSVFDIDNAVASQLNTASENSSQQDDCCHKAKTHSTRSENPVNSSSDNQQVAPQVPVSSCSLLPKNISSTKISSLYDDNLSVKAALITLPFAALPQFFETKFSPAILPLNRGGTYLRHCVLLI